MQKGTVGGILAIISSVLGVLLVLPLLFYPAIMNSIFETSEFEMGTAEEMEALEMVMSFMNAFIIGTFVVFLIIGALGVAGGIFAIKRKVWGLALAGAIAGSILFYPLGIVSVILVSMGHLEFKKPEPVPAAFGAPPPAL